MRSLKMHESMGRLHEISGLNRKKDIADKMGVAQSSVSNWAARGLSQKAAKKAAKIWGVNADYILQGYPDVDDAKLRSEAVVDEIRYKRDGYIPLLNPLCINSYHDLDNMGGQGNEVMWRSKPPHLSNSSFIFIYTGRSMEPVFLRFDQLYIETKVEVSDLNDGDYVLVIEEGNTAPVLRRLIFGDNINDKLLVSTNRNLPGFETDSIDNYRLVGVVDSFVRYFRNEAPWF